MPDIHIHRKHPLGLQQARQIAIAWAKKAEAKFDMECTYEEGDTHDTLVFSRTGVKGTLRVDAHQFDMKAQLGFLLGAFKDRIESEIGNQLDALLNGPHAAATKTTASAADKVKKAAPSTAPVRTRAESATPAQTKAKPKVKGKTQT